MVLSPLRVARDLTTMLWRRRGSLGLKEIIVMLSAIVLFLAVWYVIKSKMGALE